MSSSESPAAAHGHGAATGDDSPVGVTILVLIGSTLAFVALALRGPGEAQSITDSAKIIEAALYKSHRTNRAAEVGRACERADCNCAVVAARHGVDVELETVRSLLSAAAGRCSGTAALPGLTAETLVRAGQDAEGLAEAKRILTDDPTNAYALYARALAEHRSGRSAAALSDIDDAVAAGRGATAHLLRGLILFNMNQFEPAKQAFSTILKTEPDDVDALFNIAVVSHRQKLFHRAREEYLKVTRTDPKHADARYNLAVLTHSIGATDEANHHLRKFEALVPPGDERIQRLKTVLAGPTPEAQRLGAPGAPPPAAAPPPPAVAAPPLPAKAEAPRPPPRVVAPAPKPAPVAPRPAVVAPAAPAPGAPAAPAIPAAPIAPAPVPEAPPAAPPAPAPAPAAPAPGAQ